MEYRVHFQCIIGPSQLSICLHCCGLLLETTCCSRQQHALRQRSHYTIYRLSSSYMDMSYSLYPFCYVQLLYSVYRAFWVRETLYCHMNSCLRVFTVGMRMLHVEDAEDMGGASKDEIARIPVYRFKSLSNPPASTEDVEMQELPQKPQQQQVVREQTYGFWSQLQTRFGLSDGSDDQHHIEHEPELDTIEIPNEQDRVCAICLSTYDDGDILCQLW